MQSSLFFCDKGTCKHAVAFLMWLRRRTEEPSPTEIVSYWKKPKLSGVNKNEILKLSDFGVTNVKVKNSEKVLDKFISGLPTNDSEKVMLKDVIKSQQNSLAQNVTHLKNLSLHALMCMFQQTEKNLEFSNFHFYCIHLPYIF